MNDQHDLEQLAAYAVGLLDGEEARTTEAHVAGCQCCRQEVTELREVDAAIRRVPPELFLDGPPEGGELVLQRALRQVREERSAEVVQLAEALHQDDESAFPAAGVRGPREPRPRRHTVEETRMATVARGRRQRRALLAAAVAVVVAVGAAGVALGRGTAGETITAAPTTPAETGSRQLTGFNQSTGAQMTVTVTPAAGWVRVKATVVGIPAGERCTLVVIDRNRNRYTAASWLVSPAGEESGTTVDGAAIVAPEDVAAIAVQNDEYRQLVIAPT